MSFYTATCKDIRLGPAGTGAAATIYCTAQRADGSWNTNASINLNDHITNNDGSLQSARNGRFMDTSRNFSLSPDCLMLYCEARTKEITVTGPFGEERAIGPTPALGRGVFKGAHFYLAHHLANQNGNLRWIN